MRLLLSLSLLLLISSCGHNKIRKVRVNNKKTELVRKSSLVSRVIIEEDVAAATEEDLIQNPSESFTTYSTEDVDETKNGFGYKDFRKQSPSPQDSTNSDPPKISQESFDEAQESEENARKAKLFFAIALIGTLILVTALIAVIFFIIGNRHYKKAKRARYSTPEGEQSERFAKILKIIYISLFIVVILLAAVILYFLVSPLAALMSIALMAILFGFVALLSNIFL